MNVHSHVQSRKLVHVSGVHCHMRASSTSGCAFVYFTVQCCIECSSTVSLFQAQDVKRKSSSDVAGTTLLFKVLYCKIKNVLFFVFVCFLCIICVKSIINLFQYSTI